MKIKFLKLFSATLLTILTSELLVMAILYFFPIQSPLIEALADGILLTIIVTPILYRLIIFELLLKNLKLEQEKTAHAMGNTLGHEINNPLTIALGNVLMLKKETSDKRLDVIDDSLIRIRDIVAKVRDLEKIEFGSIGESTESVMLKKDV